MFSNGAVAAMMAVTSYIELSLLSFGSKPFISFLNTVSIMEIIV